MIHGSMFFDGWAGIVRVIILSVLGYAALFVMLRAAKKRTLAQMNVYDFLYVVIVGELLAITIMDEAVSLAEGVAAMAVLIAIQMLLSWLTIRWAKVEHFINGEPTLLMRNGKFLARAMQDQRITEREVLSAIREEGVADLEQVEAVVLETNGAFSVVHLGKPRRSPSLADVPDGA